MRAANEPRGPSGRNTSSAIPLSGLKAARMRTSRASSSHAAATNAVPLSPCFVNRAIAFLNSSGSGATVFVFANFYPAKAFLPTYSHSFSHSCFVMAKWQSEKILLCSCMLDALRGLIIFVSSGSIPLPTETFMRPSPTRLSNSSTEEVSWQVA